jgi:hypothetical protein
MLFNMFEFSKGVINLIDSLCQNLQIYIIKNEKASSKYTNYIY